MPCYKCSNGKWRYGNRGKCVFDTLKECQDAEAAIHAQEDEKDSNDKDCGCVSENIDIKDYY